MVIVAPIIIGLGVLVSWVVLFGLRRSWAYIASAFIRLFKGGLHLKTVKFGPIPLISFGRASTLSQSERDLGAGAQGAEPGTAGFLAGMAAVAEYHAFTTKYLAFSTLEALIAIPRYTVPHGVKVRTQTAREQSEAAAKRARVAGRDSASARARAGTAERIATRAENRAKAAQATALAAAGAAAVTHPWDLPATRRIEIDSRIGRWINTHIGRLSKYIGAAIGAGVVARVLVRHLPWYQCRNVNRLARRACAMDNGLLDDLLAATLAAGSLISIVTFAKELQNIVEVEAKAIRWAVGEARAIDRLL